MNAMYNSSMFFTVYVPILMALWVSFVKSSLQAAGCLALLLVCTNQFELLIPVGFLLCLSLLIPKQNPKYLKRKFQLGKLISCALVVQIAWLVYESGAPSAISAIHHSQELELATKLISPAAILTFVIILLFTRHHVR